MLLWKKISSIYKWIHIYIQVPQILRNKRKKINKHRPSLIDAQIRIYLYYKWEELI